MNGGFNMEYKIFKKVRILIKLFVFATVTIAVVYDNLILALAGVLIGLLFFFLVKRKTKAVLVDERIKSIGGYAACLTHTVLTCIIAFLSLVFIISGRQTGESQIETLGIVLSYVTLLSLAIYSISYRYYLKRYSDKNGE